MENNLKPDQAYIMHEYNKTHREQFNQELFERKDEDIINAIKQVILSCQRTKYVTIRVMDFEVIDDYQKVKSILRSYEENRIKKSKVINSYDYIDLKDSDIYLLKVYYYIRAKDGDQMLNVYIALPRIVNKYYFHIGGNDYYAMYQIVDNSTYNNSMASSAKHQTVTLKTIFMPIRIYREVVTLCQRNGEAVKAIYYPSVIFNKNLSAIKYILAKLGFVGCLDFMGYNSLVDIVTKDFPVPIDYENNYYFMTQADDILIKVPKMIFDNDYTFQSLVVTMVNSICSGTTANDIFNNQFWIVSLGNDFKNYSNKKSKKGEIIDLDKSIKKGESVLDSLESIYDIITYNDIKLPDEKKRTIYHIILWMLREFPRLRVKDNLNLSFKKVRIAEYIASLYVAKLSRGIYRIADSGSNVTLNQVRKALNIMPMALIHNISKCNLVNYKNNVNDLDSIYALKFSYKGISGIGDGNRGKSVPDTYRMIHPSHIGRIDLDTSSATDPGMTGILCPHVDLYNNMMFSDAKEPDEWEKEFSELMDNFKKINSLKEVMQIEKRVLDIEDPVRCQMVEESQNIINGLIRPMRIVISREGLDRVEVPFEDSGRISSSYEELIIPQDTSGNDDVLNTIEAEEE